VKLKLDVPQELIDEIARRVVVRLEEFFLPILGGFSGLMEENGDTFDGIVARSEAAKEDFATTILRSTMEDPLPSAGKKKITRGTGNLAVPIPPSNEEMKRRQEILKSIETIKNKFLTGEIFAKSDLQSLITKYTSVFGFDRTKVDLHKIFRAVYDDEFISLDDLPEDEELSRKVAEFLFQRLSMYKTGIL
jgi:hypothetical protein